MSSMGRKPHQPSTPRMPTATPQMTATKVRLHDMEAGAQRRGGWVVLKGRVLQQHRREHPCPWRRPQEHLRSRGGSNPPSGHATYKNESTRMFWPRAARGEEGEEVCMSSCVCACVCACACARMR